MNFLGQDRRAQCFRRPLTRSVYDNATRDLPIAGRPVAACLAARIITTLPLLVPDPRSKMGNPQDVSNKCFAMAIPGVVAGFST
jgi:hypothetical protein